MTNLTTWAEICTGRLAANFETLRRSAGGDHVLAVVKADAYGHGGIRCAPVLARSGAEWLGVTSVEEAVSLRECCPESRLLVMASFWRGEATAMIDHRLTPLVWEPYHIEELDHEAERRRMGQHSIPIHLEIDSGMARQGVRGIPALKRMVELIANAPAVRIEGVMTHFSSPDELDSAETALQLERFAKALEVIAADGQRPEWVHAGNSATFLSGFGVEQLRALATRYGTRLMLRPGLALYGYPVRFIPDQIFQPPLGPVLSWKARITSLRTIPRGAPVGYNASFRATRQMRLALLRVGYADGLNRLLSNRGHVLVRGHRAPIAGRISMDQTSIDVTDIPGTAIGDEVVLIGEQGLERITAYDHADLCGTIPYEVLCGIGARVPRLTVE